MSLTLPRYVALEIRVLTKVGRVGSFGNSVRSTGNGDRGMNTIIAIATTREVADVVKIDCPARGVVGLR